MPYLNIKVTVPEAGETTTRICRALTDLTAEVLKKKKELTSVAVEYIRPENWFVGGSAVASEDTATFFLDIKVTEGTNTKDEKALYISKIFEAVESVIGKLNPASYIVIHEVKADAWGYSGATQEYRFIAPKCR